MRTKEKKHRLLTILKLGFALIFIVGLTYTIFFTRLFEIQKIDIVGGADTLEEQAALNTYLQEYLGANLLSFPSDQHESELLAQYPYLKDLKIGKRPFHSLKLTLSTYEQAANVQINHQNGTKQFYIINELGYIASSGTINESLPTIVMDVTGTDLELPEEGGSYEVNQEMIPKETINTLLETKKSFEAKFNMQVYELHYLKRAKELHIYTERYFFVWLDLSQPIDNQLSKLKKALTKLNIYEADLNYIDLRISGQNGEKVIYKLN